MELSFIMFWVWASQDQLAADVPFQITVTKHKVTHAVHAVVEEVTFKT